jgi:hypothetical protein
MVCHCSGYADAIARKKGSPKDPQFLQMPRLRGASVIGSALELGACYLARSVEAVLFFFAPTTSQRRVQ